jgi:hypothetical protein
MIVQITLTRDEAFLIEQLLPQWKKYADGFVFLVDSKTTDNTLEILNKHKQQYNILDVIVHDTEACNPNEKETFARQKLFDTGYKYSNKIICLDTDEYLDGTATKKQLENLLDNNSNTVFFSQWIQYTSKNQRRIDGPWQENFKERIGTYTNNAQFIKTFNHSSHLPHVENYQKLHPTFLFVAHLQWLDKRWAGVKQYYWKVWDYIHNLNYNIPIIDKNDYNVSVNNFAWNYEYFNVDLKIDEKIYSKQNFYSFSKIYY